MCFKFDFKFYKVEFVFRGKLIRIFVAERNYINSIVIIAIKEALT